MKIIENGHLADRRCFTVIRIMTPDREIPAEVVRYFIASFGFDSYRSNVNNLSYWRLYYRESLAGNLAPEVIDHHFLMKIDGQWAGRIWFAYNPRTGHGNFGNVYTEPEFRQLGVMGILMRHMMADFHASPAEMLCCASGNKIAVASYLKKGFRLIYGGETGPLCLHKKGTFQEEELAAFPGCESVAIRSGTIGDQFECDKFLYYTAPMWLGNHSRKFGLAAMISDYRIAFQEQLSGNGVVKVMETASGVIPGFAFALRIYDQEIFNFTCHPAYLPEVSELLQQTAGDFYSRFGSQPVCAVGIGERERLEAVRSAGFQEEGGLNDQYFLFRCSK